MSRPAAGTPLSLTGQTVVLSLQPMLRPLNISMFQVGADTVFVWVSCHGVECSPVTCLVSFLTLSASGCTQSTNPKLHDLTHGAFQKFGVWNAKDYIEGLSFLKIFWREVGNREWRKENWVALFCFCWDFNFTCIWVPSERVTLWFGVIDWLSQWQSSYLLILKNEPQHHSRILSFFPVCLQCGDSFYGLFREV